MEFHLARLGVGNYRRSKGLNFGAIGKFLDPKFNLVERDGIWGAELACDLIGSNDNSEAYRLGKAVDKSQVFVAINNRRIGTQWSEAGFIRVDVGRVGIAFDRVESGLKREVIQNPGQLAQTTAHDGFEVSVDERTAF